MPSVHQLVSALTLVLLAGAGCAPRGAGPRPTPGRSDGGASMELRPDCAALLAAIVAEYGAVSPDFACERRLDLDGDGRIDRAFLTTTDGTNVRLAVAMGDQPAVVVGTATVPISELEYQETDRRASTNPGFEWLVDWKIARRVGTRLVVTTGFYPNEFEVPDARGDALWMTSSDTAVLFYRSADGWMLMNLGY